MSAREDVRLWSKEQLITTANFVLKVDNEISMTTDGLGYMSTILAVYMSKILADELEHRTEQAVSNNG